MKAGKKRRRMLIAVSAGAVLLFVTVFWAAFHYNNRFHTLVSNFYHQYLAPPPQEPDFAAFKTLTYGVDFSHHQGKINWNILKRSGKINGKPIRFVFLKATEGQSFIDHHFKRNWNQAKRLGFLCGAYLFYDPNTNSMKQFKNFRQVVRLRTGDLPPVLDVETRGRLSHSVFNKGVLNLLKLLENEYGVKPIIYTSPGFYNRNLTARQFKDYPLWISYFGENMPVRYRKRWVFWQFSDRMRVKGVNSPVDANVFRGDRQKIQSLLIP